MAKPLFETSLLQPVLRHLRGRRFTRVLTEVPFYDYRIDVFGFSGSEDLTVGVELKLDKWRRAFEQALVYQLCVDLSLVALPNATALRADLDLFAGSGIGVISVSDSGRCRLIVPPIQSSVVRPHYRNELLQMLAEFA